MVSSISPTIPIPGRGVTLRNRTIPAVLTYTPTAIATISRFNQIKGMTTDGYFASLSKAVPAVHSHLYSTNLPRYFDYLENTCKLSQDQFQSVNPELQYKYISALYIKALEREPNTYYNHLADVILNARDIAVLDFAEIVVDNLALMEKLTNLGKTREDSSRYILLYNRGIGEAFETEEYPRNYYNNFLYGLRFAVEERRAVLSS